MARLSSLGRLPAVLAALLVALALLGAAGEARPSFSGLVSVDLSGLATRGYSSRAGRGCHVVTNALARDLSEFPGEAELADFRICDWV